MTKVQYFTAATIDGYIADEHNSLDWLFAVDDPPDPAWEERFFADVGALACGSATYEWVVEHERLQERPEVWSEIYPGRPTWVFTNRELPVLPGVDIRFVSGDVVDVYPVMAEAAGDRNIWVIGGGDLVGKFDDPGLLDESFWASLP